MAIKETHSKGWADYWRRPFTSARCIWEACLDFHSKNDRPPTYADIKNLNLRYIDKKGELQSITSENQIKTEVSNYKQFCKKHPDAKELEILKKNPDLTTENNTLDIYDTHQDIPKFEDQHIFPDEIQDSGERLPPERRIYETNTIIRDQRLPIQIKEMYEYRCQICEVRLESGNYKYAEAAHIKALGKPHNGDDLLNNILCLCPNHHKLFDMGGFFIEDDLTIPVLKKKLYKHPDHTIDLDAIRYHRAWCIES